MVMLRCLLHHLPGRPCNAFFMLCRLILFLDFLRLGKAVLLLPPPLAFAAQYLLGVVKRCLSARDDDALI